MHKPINSTSGKQRWSSNRPQWVQRRKWVGLRWQRGCSGIRRSVGGCIPGLCKLNIKMYYPKIYSKLLLRGMVQKHLPSNRSRQQKKQLKWVKTKQKFSFDVGFYAQRRWLKWDAHGWQGWVMVGRSWSGCGYGPAALSLALGCSRRQGHMPEGELASLLPAQPGGFLKPLLSVFLFLAHHLLFIIQNLLALPLFRSAPCLFQSFLCLFICSTCSHFFRFSSLSDSLHLLLFVFPLYISE